MPASRLRIAYVAIYPPPSGGVRVMSKQLAEGLARRSDVEIVPIDLTVPPGGRRPTHWLRCMNRLRHEARRADVVFFSAPDIYIDYLGPIAWGIARRRGLPFVLRCFGGCQRRIHMARPWPRRALVERTALRASLGFFETKADVQWFADHCPGRMEWLPNMRPKPVLPMRESRDHARRFIFLGFVNEAKGIRLLIDAVRQTKEPIEVDLFGVDEMGVETLLRPDDRVRYGGVLEQQQIYATLSEYDALVLPSSRGAGAVDAWTGAEGYPGVIIEAFMVGLPVIASRLEGIMEMTVEGEDALLVSPGDASALAATLDRIAAEPHTYQRLAAGAAQARDRFSADTWTDRAAECLKAL